MYDKGTYPLKSLTLTAPRTLVQEALALSSGTLATLTGYAEYEQLDAIQTAFVAFCGRHSGYDTWQAAWTAFQASRNVQAPAPRRPVQQRFEFGFELT